MTTDASRARIHAVLDHLETAKTPGAVLDSLPDSWQRFLTGPDEDGFHFAVRPDDCPGVLARIYDRGLSMGKGRTQMEAIADAIRWIRLRVPRSADADAPVHPHVPSHLSMHPASDLETARRRMLLIAHGRDVADAYGHHVDGDLSVDEMFRSHLSLLLAATTGEAMSAQCRGDLLSIAHGYSVEDNYGPDGDPVFQSQLRAVLDLMPGNDGPQWLAMVETDGAITRILGVFAAREGAILACTALLNRQASALPDYDQRSETWSCDWKEQLREGGLVEYHPSNGMVDPRQKLRIMAYEIV